MVGNIKIADFQEGNTRVDVEGEIIERGDARTVKLRAGGESTVTDFTLKDDSGSVKLPLWGDQANEVDVGDKVAIDNGYVKSFRGE